MKYLFVILVLAALIGSVSAEFPESITEFRGAIDLTPYLTDPGFYTDDGISDYAYWSTPKDMYQSLLVVSAFPDSGTHLIVGYTNDISQTVTILGSDGSVSSTATDKNGIFIFRVTDSSWVRISAGSLSQVLVFTDNISPILSPNPIKDPSPEITLYPGEDPTQTYLTLSTSDRWPGVGDSVTFSGVLGAYGDQKPLSGYTVSYDISEDGATYEHFGSVITNSQGRFQFTLNTHEGGFVYIRATFDGESGYKSTISPAIQIISS